MDASGVIGRVCVEGTIVACYERRTVTSTQIMAVVEDDGAMVEYVLCNLLLQPAADPMPVFDITKKKQGRRRGKG